MINIDVLIKTVEHEIKMLEKSTNELRVHLRELRQLAKEEKRVSNELTLLTHGIDVKNNSKDKMN